VIFYQNMPNMSFLAYITGFFYELWTFADFDRLCKLEKSGDEIKKKSSLKPEKHGIYAKLLPAM
jgi:hypothetical protein